MSSLLEMLTSQLGGSTGRNLLGKLGIGGDGAKSALGAALPLILGALARNSSKDDGAKSLHKAIEKDHDGSVLDDVVKNLGGGGGSAGAGILKHVFGDRRRAVEEGVSRAAGVDRGAAGGLLEMLAPMVMGAVGKEQRKQGLDAPGLARMLSGEQREIEKRAPNAGGLLGSLLDQDGDGDADLGDLSKGLGGLFR